MDTKLNFTDTTPPKDITNLLMTRDEFDFTSTYYYSTRKMERQEKLQKLTSFLSKRNIPVTDAIRKDIDALKEEVKYYESKSIIGNTK
jgi:hypothetical protein